MVPQRGKDVADVLYGAVAGALVIGFLAGLLAFRFKQQWCPACGVTLTCPESSGHGR